MKFNWAVGMLLATSLTLSVSAQVSVYIRTSPPPMRVETRGAAPGPGYAWVDGYWTPNGRHYQWVSGRWDRPPYEGAHWQHAHYDHHKQGWQLHEGHWDHDNQDHDRGRDHNNH